MPKTLQNIFIFIEPQQSESITTLKCGNMILNRFCVEEDATFELSGVYYLNQS